MVKDVDILKEIGRLNNDEKVVIGFDAETHDIEKTLNINLGVKMLTL